MNSTPILKIHGTGKIEELRQATPAKTYDLRVDAASPLADISLFTSENETIPDVFLRRFFEIQRITGTVVEVGCGNSSVLPSSSNASLFAVDVFEEALAQIREASPHVATVCEDLRNLPRPTGILSEKSVSLCVWNNNMLAHLRSRLGGQDASPPHPSKVADESSHLHSALGGIFGVLCDGGYFMQINPRDDAHSIINAFWRAGFTFREYHFVASPSQRKPWVHPWAALFLRK